MPSLLPHKAGFTPLLLLTALVFAGFLIGFREIRRIGAELAIVAAKLDEGVLSELARPDAGPEHPDPLPEAARGLAAAGPAGGSDHTDHTDHKDAVTGPHALPA